MLSSIIWQILLLCTFRIFVVENAAMKVCSEGSVGCLCGEEPNYEIKYFSIQAFNAGAEDCLEISSSVCASHSCACCVNNDTSVVAMEEKNDVLAKKVSLRPVKIFLPPLDDEAEESHPILRHRRFPKSCNDSISPIRHAVMDCALWPEFITCNINCTHGYATMEDGKAVLQTTRNCRESESTWKPKASFPVCEPYINCKAILVRPGDLDCKTSGPMISYCDISCEAYEDKDEVPKKRYECFDENFAKTLPHCATTAKNVHLIRRPQTSQGRQMNSQDHQNARQGSQKAFHGP